MKWDSENPILAPQDCFVEYYRIKDNGEEQGAIAHDSRKCDCAGSLIGGSAHEPHCGLSLVGFIPDDMILTNLWDFTQI